MAPPSIGSIVLRNLRYVAPLALVNTAGYLFLNHRPFFERHLLPLTTIDRAIPFLVWTIWPYLALLGAAVVLPLLIRDEALFRRVLLGYAIAIGLNFLCWALYPTGIARPPLPLDDTLSAAAYRLFVAIDDVGNCFPSGHVTIPAVATWGLALENPRWRAWLWSGLGLLALSILTTKQHYLADLFGGFATAATGLAIAGVRSQCGPAPRALEE